MGMRVTTWNVNGIRNPFGYQPWSTTRTFDAMFEILEADIVVMQELKIQRKDLKDDMVLVPGWDCFFSLPKHKKGYSGVGIYTRQSVCQPIRAEEGLLGVLCPPGSDVPYRDLPDGESIGGYPSYAALLDLDVDLAVLDSEGRCVVVEFPAFVIFGVYCPANTRGDEAGDKFRHAFWNALDIRIRKLHAMGKRVILTGDLNNAKCELDIAGSEEDKRKEGVTHADFVSTPNRRIFNQMLTDGEVFGQRDEGREEPVLWDTTRAFHSKREGMYTHWDTKKNTRPGNFGSRIDYVLTSVSMESWITDANIQEGLQGSDHCPVFAIMDDIVTIGDDRVHLKDIMNPPGYFEGGQRRKDIPSKATLAFSARLLPEFNVGQRQNIKDMFKRQPSGVKKLSMPTLSQGALAHPATTITESSTDASLPRHSTQTSSASQTSTQSPSKASGTKRKPSEVNGSKAKKTKSSTSAASPPNKGQGTLRAFFRPAASDSKSSALESDPEPAISVVVTNASTSLHQAIEQSRPPSPRGNGMVADAAGPAADVKAEQDAAGIDGVMKTSSDEGDEAALSHEVEKRIDSSAKWGKLMRKPKIPLCEDHDEPCKQFQTKKKGANCGRIFYICARPLGPSGEKEKNTQWRCRTFIWASDWQGGAASAGVP